MSTMSCSEWSRLFEQIYMSRDILFSEGCVHKIMSCWLPVGITNNASWIEHRMNFIIVVILQESLFIPVSQEGHWLKWLMLVDNRILFIFCYSVIQ